MHDPPLTTDSTLPSSLPCRRGGNSNTPHSPHRTPVFIALPHSTPIMSLTKPNVTKLPHSFLRSLTFSLIQVD
ncbi:hypothetical protein E2C01_034078 [Portunus trituberculatus]|uniref:Uncharacterized protein n=1 Tax=Portunus trituberculatus TaxID=210409 RepID=A0A5B7F5W0_PORTR|nr:hypothetical protein [Portunus trituberculatus]